MKLQDILFVIILVVLFFSRRSSRVFVIVGLICLAISIPLFAKWIFFTAERLTWYAAVFFSIAVVMQYYSMMKK